MMCQACWPYGNIDVGDKGFNYAAINYLAKHQMKDCSGTKFQREVSPIFKRQSKYKGGIGVNEMCNDLSIHSKVFGYDEQKGVQIEGTDYLVGVPRAVRKKLKPDLLTPSQLTQLSRDSSENFKKFTYDYLMNFPELSAKVDVTDFESCFRVVINHSFREDKKKKAEYKVKKYYENIKKINKSLRSADVR